jgi:hypothetical protein
MSEYNVKYRVGQEVYILSSRAFIKSRIEKIRITEQSPYIKGETMEEMDGIEIDYLVVAKEVIDPIFNSRSCSFEWYSQDDVYLNKEELIAKLK